jgi:DNA-binding LacI/PurR family transcriptional regulator
LPPKPSQSSSAGRRDAPLTAQDLAQLIGVSQSTVSRAFSRHASIAPDMRERVMQAARALGYQPNSIAQSLANRRSNLVGIVVADMTNPFYPQVLERLTRALQAEGLQTLLFSVPAGEEIDRQLPLLLQYNVDAVVIASATISSVMARDWAATGRSVVLFNRIVPDARATSVSCDNVAGGRMVADLLLAQGRRRLAFVAGRADTSTNLDRARGFIERLGECGVSLHAREEGGDYTYRAGYDAMLRLGRGPDGVFFANDILALGGLDALRHVLGAHVPQDVSVVGFDDIAMAEWPSYRLTTVQQPVADMVDIAVRALVDALVHKAGTPRTHLVPGLLIERSTTGVALT